MWDPSAQSDAPPGKSLCLNPRAFLFFLAVILFIPLTPSWALDFGQNKVRYHTDHHWKYIETEHFDVYYYERCQALAEAAADMAERAFVGTCQAFDYVPKTRIPLFLYATPLEFEETNITPEILSEGVGGFTEAFKNRIVVPMDGSYHEFEKVIHHELTHAFQYDLIYGEGWRSVNLLRPVFVPTWMMEGMAEWNAQHLDAQGEMVLRDAVLNDLVMPLKLMESFDHFPQVYTAYKESQSVLDYITQVYGDGKVAQLFKHMAANQSPDTATKSVLGVSLDDLYNNWHFFMRTKAWSRINGLPAPEKYGDSLEKGSPTAALKGALSPDGKTLALLKGRELSLIRVADKNKTVLLNRHFQTQGSGVAWSPDGKTLAFSADRNGEYHLYLYEIAGRQLRECPIQNLPVIASPAWSPDQKFIVFSGFDYETTDLYRYEVATGKLERLTHDRDYKSWAQYGPDGKSLYFINEEAGRQEILRTALNDQGIPTGEPQPVGRNLGTLTSLTVRSGHLTFTSDLSRRIFNVFQTDMDGGHLTQLTNTFADVVSALPDPEGKKLYAVCYQKGMETLYAFDGANLEGQEWPNSAFETMTQEFSYISNSFQDASKVIAFHPVTETVQEVELPPTGQEREEPEIVAVKKPPTRPPAAVASLAVAEESNIVELQWPTTGTEEDSVDNYRVYRAAAAGATFTYLGTAPSLRHGMYIDYDVRIGGTYFYYVTAVNKLGESPPSPTVEARPSFKVVTKDYQFSLTPDLLLFLAGYDSAFGFVGGGLVEMSDELGDHRLGIEGDTVPGVDTGVDASYEFSQWRTTVDLNLFYYQNYYNLYNPQTGVLTTAYHNNANGFTLNFSYPIDTYTRVEYGVGTERFLGSPLYLQFSEGISNYNLNEQWTVANFYRLSFVQDRRQGSQFWPSSGYGLNFTLLHALPVLDYNASFANLLFETDVFADFSFLNHLVWANRVIAMTSQGPNPQTFFIGDDDVANTLLGGYFTTIRGYNGATFFGSDLGLVNSELRYPIATNMNFTPQPLSFLLIKDIELAGFMDAGIVSNQIQDLVYSPVLASLGTGIRFYTFFDQRALVMFRFDVAWALTQSSPPEFDFNLAPMF